jgi:hypothetical protein
MEIDCGVAAPMLRCNVHLFCIPVNHLIPGENHSFQISDRTKIPNPATVSFFEKFRQCFHSMKQLDMALPIP